MTNAFLTRLGLLSIAFLALLWIHPGSASAQQAPADLPPEKARQFLELLSGSGVHLWACRMSADMQHLELDDLYDEVEAIISASDFIEITAGAQLLFI